MHALHNAFSLTKKPCSELGQLKWLLSQSYWSNDKLQMVGRYCTNTCECGHTPQNFLHIIYDCPLLSEKRYSFKWLKGFLDCNPTEAMKLGLPPEMSADPTSVPLFG